ncbi:MAG: acyl-ACP--UDP-N-acetylglucosamine O-acyltransferase [Chloroflexota bacterium]
MTKQAIHETSLIHPGAELGPNVEIGPFCRIEAGVVIGANTRLLSHVVLQGPLTMGQGNIVHPFVVLGGDPQDLNYDGETVGIEIGDHNTFRESVTVSRGTTKGRGLTKIGNHNLFMAYCHVGHDGLIGDYNAFVNSVQLSGHTTIGNHVLFSGLSGTVQFIEIGDYAYIIGQTAVGNDFPPFCIGQGARTEVRGVNIIGLRRQGFTRGDIRAIRDGYELYYKSGLSHQDALVRLAELAEKNDKVSQFYEFIKNSKNGVAPGRAT